MAKFRILSLDGGGAWALIQAVALRELYGKRAKGHDVLKDFDLVAANSGGSIVLAGLLENLTLQTLLDDYFMDKDKRTMIFSTDGVRRDLWTLIFSLFGLAPRYSTAAKLAGLKALLRNSGDVQVRDLPKMVKKSVGSSPQFLICGFNYDTKRVAFFRSDSDSRSSSFATDSDATLAEAVNVSSTAPVRYFDAPAQIGTARYWDGAVAGYNNPVLAAVVEALANKIRAANIVALSIGTGSVRRPIRQPDQIDDTGLMVIPQTSNPVNDVKELAGAIVDDPPDAASYIAHVTLNQNLPQRQRQTVQGSLVRMSPMVQPIWTRYGWALPVGFTDDPDGGRTGLQKFLALADLDMDAVEQGDVMNIREFAEQWVKDGITNQAIRSNSETYRCEIGCPSFSRAKKVWLKLLVGRHRVSGMKR
ncbi:MAG: patatin-like phospholipase family protein [Pseudolabrys sp.]